MLVKLNEISVLELNCPRSFAKPLQFGANLSHDRMVVRPGLHEANVCRELASTSSQVVFYKRNFNMRNLYLFSFWLTF